MDGWTVASVALGAGGLALVHLGSASRLLVIGALATLMTVLAFTWPASCVTGMPAGVAALQTSCVTALRWTPTQALLVSAVAVVSIAALARVRSRR